ncbi:MAG: polyribonucleotide nucleotidyltransferase [Planctomycetota bacterium]|jgi:polyribonucleotide nucleotidyltransferase
MATKKSADGASAPKKARSSAAKAPAKKKAAKKAPAKKAVDKAEVDKAEVGKAAPKRAAAKKGGTGAIETAGPFIVERQIGGRTLSLETGRMAKLSDGAVLARYGDTVVFAAANSTTAPDYMDFFPLTVDYREKTSAMGVIPGGFFKREGRPSTKEILTCRIIDRSIRPMFPDGFRRDVQVLSQVIASDRENDGDVIAAIASFAALAVSSLPHGRSLGCVRMGYINDKVVINPVWSELQSDENKLNLTVCGHSDAVVMVEAGAKEVKEEVVLKALGEAHKVIKVIVEMIEELTALAGKPKMEFEAPVRDEKLIAKIEKACGKDLRKAPTTLGPKAVRGAAIKAAKKAAKAAFPAPKGANEAEEKAWYKKTGEIFGDIIKLGERESILNGVRADGRDSATIRPITIEVGVLPRVHGSVLFTRGETQALGVVTLGSTDDRQIIDGLMPEPRKRFMLHYAFPPFSVGETKRMLAPGRREIGHGALAERGLESLLPDATDFPYTIRINSEIMESNGSSSMATACAGTLAMMDAGVPIKQPVAGIAMGLVMEGKDYTVLSDILGSEDGCGDMDFKVIGTGRGITALQMDIKCEGLTSDILAEALDQAKEGRLHILREMLKSLRAPRKMISPNAPRLESVQVPPDKIGLIIGPGGKNIRAMQEEFECKISIEDGGMCTITGTNGEKVDAAVNHVRSMTAEIELGTTYEGRVTAIKEFGAFVEILPGQEGLVHVSELSNEFIRAVTDVVKVGDTVKVKVIAIDDFGKVKLSRKALLDPAEGGESSGSGSSGGSGESSGSSGSSESGGRGESGGGDAPAREERPRREPRDDRGERSERPRREDGDRDDRPRGRRPRSEDGEERPARPRRDEERPTRARSDEERPTRARSDEERPARPRRDEERPTRARSDEARPARPGSDEERPSRPRGDDDRPARPRRDRDEAEAPRGDREDRPRGRRPRSDDGEDRPARPRRDEERPARASTDEDRPVRPRRDRDEAEAPAPRGDREDRSRGRRPRSDDGEERPSRPRGDEERPARGRGDDERPTRARGDEDRPARPRRDEERPTRSRSRDDEERPARPPRRDEERPTRPRRDEERPARAGRDEDDRPRRGQRRDEESDRPARSSSRDEDRPARPSSRDEDRPARPRRDDERPARGRDRSSMPMAEFEDGPKPAAELESIDSVIGDERGSRPPRGRRPRRQD